MELINKVFKRNQSLIWVFIWIGSNFFLRTSFALDLKAYFDEVHQKNQSYQSSAHLSQSRQLRDKEANRSYIPTFFSQIQFFDDSRVPTNPSFQAKRTRTRIYSLGLSAMTPLGVTAKLSYNVAYTNMLGISSSIIPLTRFYDAFPKLEVSIPLWSNLAGVATRAQVLTIKETNLAAQRQSEADELETILQAERQYYNLALARKVVQVQSNTLSRADVLKQWSSRRVRFQLADRSDLLQADAAYKLRELDLASAQQEEKEALRQFNLYRGRSPEENVEDLELESVDQLLSLNIPTVTQEDTLQTQALEHQAKAGKASAENAKELIKPKLDLYGFYTRNARKHSSLEARERSFDSEFPFWMVGLDFSIPLDLLYQQKLSEARELEKQSYEDKLEYTKQKDENSKLSLLKTFEQTQLRLKLVTQVVEAQERKLHHEQERLERGRTTTYQVLLFENDYAQSRLLSLQLQKALLMTRLELKRFQLSSSPSDSE